VQLDAWVLTSEEYDLSFVEFRGWYEDTFPDSACCEEDTAF
jgi:hypothetical protein